MTEGEISQKILPAVKGFPAVRCYNDSTSMRRLFIGMVLRSSRCAVLAVGVCAVALAVCARAQVDNALVATWKFKTGDDPAYAASSFDDRSWSSIQAGVRWEDQGYPTHDGYAWYRQTVRLTSALRPAAEKYGGLVLLLGAIDDTDETYFNGHLIGMTGVPDPNFKSGYDSNRVYIIRASDVNWDGPNVIAVRVFDHVGGGGIWTVTPQLRPRAPEDYLEFKPHFTNRDHVVSSDQPKPTIEIINHWSEPQHIDGGLNFDQDPGFTFGSTFNLTVAPGAHVFFDAVPAGANHAGFYRAHLSTNESPNFYEYAFGIDPEHIGLPILQTPSDLRSFWDKTLAELKTVDPQYKVIAVSPQPYADQTVYLVEMRSLGNVRVKGYLGVPKTQGKHPTLLKFPGFTQGFGPTDVHLGEEFVTFALNVRGHGNSTDDVNPGFANFKNVGIASPDTYIYRGVYMDCIRAIDFLVTRPEVDATHIAVQGPSQGGILSFWTAALDSRVALAAPAVPAAIDYWSYQEISALPGIPAETIIRTRNYFEPLNVPSWIRCPVYMAAGLFDTDAAPRRAFAMYNQLSVPRNYTLYPDAGHNLPGEYNSRWLDWVRGEWGMLGPRSFITSPLSQTVSPGATVTLSAEIDSPFTVTYQWQKNGTPIAGANEKQFTIAQAQPDQSGDYSVVASTRGGSLTSPKARVSVGTLEQGRIMNMSVRAVAGDSGSPVITGFIMSGGKKPVVIRALGPTLTTFGVSGPLPDPKLVVHGNVGGNDIVFGQNDNWSENSDLATLTAASQRMNLYPLPSNSKDAALALEVYDGRTVHSSSVAPGARGVVLMEIYDAGTGTTPRLTNISARNHVGPGERVLIAGFIIDGNVPKKVLIRGVGPGLLDFGVGGVLRDPLLTLHGRSASGEDVVIGTNDDWSTAPEAGDVIAQLNAFPLHLGSTDSALVTTLVPGAYTVVLSGVGGETGEGLIELYEVN